MTLALMIAAMGAMTRAELASVDDARIVAANWVALIEHLKGDWGGQQGAIVAGVQEFKRNGRLLGYFCQVEPRGFIVVSLLKNLAPVKVYSATCDINPQIDVGMTDVIKLKMDGILTAIEDQVGPVKSLKSGQLEAILDINYAETWSYLNKDTKEFGNELLSGEKINYQEQDVLLTSSWHQGAPYNAQCPDHSCGTDPCDRGDRTVVGCVATAASQIMRYWCWPPYGSGDPYSNTYDWPNMPDSFIGCTWDTDEVNAVAELCREAGRACNMDYGCNGSETDTYEMESGYEGPFRYDHDCRTRYRSNWDWPEWWDFIKVQLNYNRPIQYRIVGHSMVCDGWYEPVYNKFYHMNYGWAGGVPDDTEWSGFESSNAWFVLDALPGGGINEYMIVNIYPDVVLGPTPSGTYSLQAFPYRYVDQDAASDDAIFEAGQHIQFLPNVVLTGTTAAGGIRIEGAAADNSVLFTRGDETIGIRIAGAAMTLKNGGRIVFR